jgi:hypothetical protein
LDDENPKIVITSSECHDAIFTVSIRSRKKNQRIDKKFDLRLTLCLDLSLLVMMDYDRKFPDG